MKLFFALLLATASASFNGLSLNRPFDNLRQAKDSVDQQFLGVSAANPEIQIGSALQFMANLNNDVQEVFGLFFPEDLVLDENLHQDLPWDRCKDNNYRSRAAVYLAALQLDRLCKDEEYKKLLEYETFRNKVTEKLMVKFFERVIPHAPSKDLKPEWFREGTTPSKTAQLLFDLYLNQPRSCSNQALHNAFLEYQSDVGIEINRVIIDMLDEGSPLVSGRLRDFFLNIQGAMTRLNQYASKDAKNDIISMLSHGASMTHTLDQGGKHIEVLATTIKKKVAAANGETIPEPEPIPITHVPIHPPAPSPSTGGVTLVPTGELGADGFEEFIPFPDHETPGPIPHPVPHPAPHPVPHPPLVPAVPVLIPNGKVDSQGFPEYITADPSTIDPSLIDPSLIDPSLIDPSLVVPTIPHISTPTDSVDDDLIGITDEHGNPLIYPTPTTPITPSPVTPHPTTPITPLIVPPTIPPLIVPPITPPLIVPPITPSGHTLPDGTPIPKPEPTTPTTPVIPTPKPLTTPVVPKPSTTPVIKPPTTPVIKPPTTPVIKPPTSTVTPKPDTKPKPGSKPPSGTTPTETPSTETPSTPLSETPSTETPSTPLSETPSTPLSETPSSVDCSVSTSDTPSTQDEDKGKDAQDSESPS